jgi:ATP-dependent DNA ligase
MLSRRDPLPNFIKPQRLQLVDPPPARPNWPHELKYDGYRIHARLAQGGAHLLTRTGLDWTDRYQTTAPALSALRSRDAYLDGKLSAVRVDGTTSFSELQGATDQRRTTHLVYSAFDLLFLDGENMTGLPLLDRKKRLQALLKGAPRSI